jgi:membrane-associated PAP2 superfamily phosphatase
MNAAVQSRASGLGDDGRYGQPIWLPLILLFGLSAVFLASPADLAMEHWFWSSADGWRLANDPVVQFLYHYGTWPAAVVGIGGALLWAASVLTGRLRRTRPLALFLSLLLIVGPGLIINVGFKDHFGRSRPRQTSEFGGNQPYRALGELGPRDGGKSFPSGHASMGFYWLGLLIYFWKRRRNLALAFGALGLIHGLLMGCCRMAQGGHWPSDILWSAGFVYLTAWLLNLFFARRNSTQPAQATPISASAT